MVVLVNPFLDALAVGCVFLSLGHRSSRQEDLVATNETVFFREVEGIQIPSGNAVIVYKSINLQRVTRRIGIQERLVRACVRDSEGSTVVAVGSEERIKSGIDAWLTEINTSPDGNRSEVLARGNELRIMLLEGVLSRTKAQKLYIHPGSVVDAVPLDALLIGNDLVGNKYSLSVWPLWEAPLADAFTSPGKTASAGQSVFVMGPSEYKASFVEDVFSRQYNCTFVDSHKASLEVLISGLKASYVHLVLPSERYAWPGKITDKWGKGVSRFSTWDFTGIQLGLEASDKEWLSSKSVLEMDLSSCKVAFLQGADAQGGMYLPGLGRHSISSALLRAGVQGTITELWRTKPESADLLIRIFYRNILKNRQSIPDALWSAKREMHDKGYPIVEWAGWVYSGRL